MRLPSQANFFWGEEAHASIAKKQKIIDKNIVKNPLLRGEAKNPRLFRKKHEIATALRASQRPNLKDWGHILFSENRNMSPFFLCRARGKSPCRTAPSFILSACI
jgi:CRISPR/Cas system CSM-associated protein Csm4 (group 5 of RAMP superfamily)